MGSEPYHNVVSDACLLACMMALGIDDEAKRGSSLEFLTFYGLETCIQPFIEVLDQLVADSVFELVEKTMGALRVHLE